MMDTTNRFEAELFKTYWDDGLLDLLFGIGLLMIGVGWWFHQTLVAAIGPALLWTFWIPLRKRLVEPRAGYVEFSQARETRSRTHMWMVLLLGTGSFLFATGVFFYVRSAGMDARLAQIIPALPAVLLAVGAFVGAQFTGAVRFMGYGTALIAGAGLTLVYDLGPAVPMLLGGVVVTASSIVLLTRFLRASAEFEGDA